MSGYDARRPIILTAPETASARSGGKMLRRPTLDEFMLAAFAGAVFIVVQFGSDDGSDAASPAQTLTPMRDGGASSARAAPTALAAAVPSTIGTPVSSASAASATATAPSAEELDSCDFRGELERVRGAVVRIRVPEGPVSGSQGTGFHVGEGQYVTAAHVVQDESGHVHERILVESAVTGRSELAEVVRVGSATATNLRQQRDLAVLRAPPIGDSLEYRAPTEEDAARDVRALGYPWSQAEDESARIPPPVVVRGVLSNTAVRNNIAVVQADVQAQSGMSGGPLVDECGAVIAVASAVPQAQQGEVGEGLTVFISMAELDNLR